MNFLKNCKDIAIIWGVEAVTETARTGIEPGTFAITVRYINIYSRIQFNFRFCNCICGLHSTL